MKSYLSDRYFSVCVGNNYSNPTLIRAGVLQGSVIGPTLYLLYTANIPNRNDSFTALFADDTAIATCHNTYVKAVLKLQNSLNDTSCWAKQWKIAINENKSVRVDFALCPHNYLPSSLDGKVVPQAKIARYLGLHLDCKLNWAEHIRQKRNYLNLKFRKFYWLIGRGSALSLHNKRNIYIAMFKTV